MIRKSFALLLNFALSILGSIVASYITLKIANKDLLIKTTTNKYSFDFIFQSYEFYAFLLCILCIIGLNEFLKGRGTRRIPVRPTTFFRLYRKTAEIVSEIHEFQHEFEQSIKVIKEIKQSEDTSESIRDIGKFLLESLLKKIQHIVFISTGANVSVNLKVFIRSDDCKNGIDVSRQSTYLTTLAKAPSDQEKNDTKKREFNAKYYVGDECYQKIVNGKPQTIKNWITKTVIPLKEKLEYENSGEEIFVNSAYLYILGNKEHHYISNDLIKEEKKGVYVGNCKDWRNFYRSKAVFLVSPSLEENKHVDVSKPAGILIVDSRRKFIFENRFSKRLIGYFAHRLYDFVNYYNKALYNGRHLKKTA